MRKPYRVAQPVARTRPIRRIPVDIAIAHGSCSIGSKPPFHFEMDAGSIRDHNRDFVAAMKRVKNEVVDTGSLQLAPTFFEEMMDDLRDAGLSAYQSLGDQACACLDEYEERDNGLGLEITVRTEAHPLLWEFIYTGSATDPVDPCLFWGYRHPIARFLIGADFLPPNLDPQGGFLFCRNHKLMHWEDEMEALHCLAESCDFVMLDDCLDGLDPEHSRLKLHDQVLWVCTRSRAFSFVHMASHLFPDPRPDSVLGAFLVISYRDSEIKIPLRRLNAVRRDWRFWQNPVVFLNACRTMTNPEQLLQGESFPRSFLKLGAGAVIATACDMPDLFAVAFAHKFYEVFLDRRHRQSPTASDALRQARQFFIDQYNNPLGLAYGLYAYNNLTIYW
jgi:hypothetical protein